MKKNVLVFGLISGLIAAVTLLVSVEIGYANPSFKGSMLLGFGSMIVAFSLIFVSIKNYRDKYNNGTVSFWKAFKMGLYIALIGSSIYVLAWTVDYHFFHPDYMEKFTASEITQAKAANISPAELAAKQAEMAGYISMYKSPVMVVLFTYMEILPVGLIIAVFAALILKRKVRNEQVVATA